MQSKTLYKVAYQANKNPVERINIARDTSSCFVDETGKYHPKTTSGRNLFFEDLDDAKKAIMSLIDTRKNEIHEWQMKVESAFSKLGDKA